MPNFDQTAARIIESLDWDSTKSLDAAVDHCRNELATAIRKRDNYAAYRNEQYALLEHLGYARRDERGEFVITRPTLASV